MIFGLIFSTYNLLIVLGVNLPVAWKIASVEQALIGISTSAVIYVCVSLLTHDYNDKDVERLINDAGIIRNKLKIKSAINNALRVLEIQKEHGSLNAFLWSFVGGKTIQNQRKDLSEIPVTTPESDAMSKALKKAGITFIGSTSCYALMQSVGMVNDHITDCFRHKYIAAGSLPLKPFENKPTILSSYYELPPDIMEEPEEFIEWAVESLAIQKKR